LIVKGKEDETGAPLKCVYEQCGERWEVAVCVSDKG
jgi:DNA topoisomerase-2